MSIDRTKLLHGPYRPPDVRPSDTLHDERHGWVRVGGYTDAPIPWPRIRKTGRAALILCGDLIRAVRTESEIAIAAHWGVSVVTVWGWRRALGVGRITDGTRKLYRDYAPQKLTEERAERGRKSATRPEIVARLAQQRRGKAAHANTRKALLRAAKRKWRPDRRKRRSAAQAAQYAAAHPYRIPTQLLSELVSETRDRPAPTRGTKWIAAEDALLGLAPDRVIAQIVRRSRAAVCQRRLALGISPHAGRSQSRIRSDCGRRNGASLTTRTRAPMRRREGPSRGGRTIGGSTMLNKETIATMISKAKRGTLLANAGAGGTGDLDKWDEDLYRQSDGSLVLVYTGGARVGWQPPRTLTRAEAIDWIADRATKISGHKYTRYEAECIVLGVSPAV